ncbi:hypothetical protein [Nonlabens sp.]|nr:hypothetical protein [Nonlabens sp.]
MTCIPLPQPSIYLDDSSIFQYVFNNAAFAKAVPITIFTVTNYKT